MAAITQTDADKAGISPVRVKVTSVTANAAGSYTYIMAIRLGAIYLIQGTGTPNDELYAPMGSIFIDKTAGAIYRKTDAIASHTWAAFN